MAEKSSPETEVSSTPEEGDDKTNPPSFNSRGINTTNESDSTLASESSLLLLVFKETKTNCQGSCSRWKICDESSGKKRLSSELKGKFKTVSKKLKKTSRKSLDMMRDFYKDMQPKKATGFNCDLKVCESSVLDCNQLPCRKNGTFFGEDSRSDRKEQATSTKTKRVESSPKKSKQKQRGCNSKCTVCKRSKETEKVSKKNKRSKKGRVDETKLRKGMVDVKSVKRHQICECPDNPGRHLKVQGDILCCCPDDSCVTSKKIENEGISNENKASDKTPPPSS